MLNILFIIISLALLFFLNSIGVFRNLSNLQNLKPNVLSESSDFGKITTSQEILGAIDNFSNKIASEAQTLTHDLTSLPQKTAEPIIQAVREKTILEVLRKLPEPEQKNIQQSFCPRE